MRDLVTVINKIIREIPHKETDLINYLEERKESCEYTAPEAMSIRWAEVANILYDHLGEPESFNEDWKHIVFNVWMDKCIS